LSGYLESGYSCVAVYHVLHDWWSLSVVGFKYLPTLSMGEYSGP